MYQTNLTADLEALRAMPFSQNQMCGSNLFEGRRKFTFREGKVSQVCNDFIENSFTTYNKKWG